MISLLFGALGVVIVRDRELLHPWVTDAEIGAFVRGPRPNIGFYVIVLVLAAAAPRVAAFGFLVIAVPCGHAREGRLRHGAAGDGLTPLSLPG